MFNGFYYTANDSIIPAGEKTKIDANLTALRLVLELRHNGISATASDWQTISRFSGWGPMKPLLDSIYASKLESIIAGAGLTFRDNLPRGFFADEKRLHPAYESRVGRRRAYQHLNINDINWMREYGERHFLLRQLLSDDVFKASYAAAENPLDKVEVSTLTSFYTSEALCAALWEMTDKLGFKGGVIVEPSCGAGNVLGAMPREIRHMNVQVWGYDTDPVSALIAQTLYPSANIRNGEFQQAEIPEASADLLIGNVPFSDTKFPQNLAGAPPMNLHNLVIANGLARLRPGGLACVITSAGTMNSNEEQREWLADRADLVDAYRLPAGAHGKVSTDVVSDILVLRKKEVRRIISKPWRSPVPIELTHKRQYGYGDPTLVKVTLRTNEFFIAHPQRVFGKETGDGRLYGGSRDEPQYTVEPFNDGEGDELTVALTAAIAELPAVANSSERAVASAAADIEIQIAAVRKIRSLKVGSVFEEGGKLGQVALSSTGGKEVMPPPWMEEVETDDFVEMREKIFRENSAAYVLKSPRDVSLYPSAKGTRFTKTNAWTVKIWDALLKVPKLKTFNYLHTRDVAEREYRPMTFPKGFKDIKIVESLARDFIRLRDSVKEVIAIDIEAATHSRESDAARVVLRENYNAFCKKWGQVNNAPLEKFFESDPEIGLVLGLEDVNEIENDDGTTRREISPARILTKRTIFPEAERSKPTNIPDAIVQLLNIQGDVTVESLAAAMEWATPATPEQREAIQSQILSTGVVFLDPDSGNFVSRAKYLSGNVRTKLAIAQEAEKKNPMFATNVSALKAVVPPKIEFGDPLFSKRIGQTWIDGKTIDSFLQELFGEAGETMKIRYTNSAGWLVTGNANFARATAASSDIYGTDSMNGVDILLETLNGNRIRLFKMVDDKRVYDEKASNLANQKVDDIKERWRLFMEKIGKSPEAKEHIETIYNETLNSLVPPVYDGSHLLFPGLAKGEGFLNPRKHQRDAALRIIEEGRGIIAHDVGYGKTLTICLAAMERKRLGLDRKPMIVLDNASYGQIVATLRKHYPQANILAAGADSMGRTRRTAFLSRVATGDWDAVCIRQSQFDLIPNSKEMQTRYLNEELREIRTLAAQLEAVGADDKKKIRVAKKLETAEARVGEKLKALENHHDNCLPFDMLGTDIVFIDEGHKYKRVGFRTAMDAVKGISSASSMRGDSLYMKAEYLHSLRGGGQGVVLFTATPITNTVAEIWTMLRLADPVALQHGYAETFDNFRRNYTETVTAVELHEATNRWKVETRLSKFVNPVAFLSMVRSAVDVKNNPAEIGIERPDLLTDKSIAVTTPLTPPVNTLLEKFQDVWAAYEKITNKREASVSAIPLVLIGASMAASIDPRLVDGAAADDPGSTVNRAVTQIFDIWRRTQKGRETQAVFLDRRNQMDLSFLSEVISAAEEGKIEDVQTIIEEPTATAKKEKDDGEEEGTVDLTTDAPAPAGRFDLYKDIVEKLVSRGVPRPEICVIQEAKKEELPDVFARVNRGSIRIIIGSTAKLGTGVNIQKRLIAAHHIDPPRDMTPASLQQRNGRVLRQGNENKQVAIYNYGMVDTPTAGIYHRILRKQFFCSQALAGNAYGEFEDCGSLELEDLKACLVSDKRVMQLAELKAEIKAEKTKIETQQSAIRLMRQLLENRRFSLNYSRGEAESAKRRLALLAEHGVKPISDKEPTEVELSFFPKNYFAAKLPGDVVFKGIKAEIGEQSKGLIAKLLECAASLHTDSGSITLASGTIGGLRFGLQLTNTASGMTTPTFAVQVRITDPLDNKGCPATSWSISSGVSFVTALNKQLEKWENSVTAHVSEAKVRAAGVAETEAELAKRPPTDESHIVALLEQQKAIETDLRENPVTRRVDSPLDRFRARKSGVPLPSVTRGVTEVKPSFKV